MEIVGIHDARSLCEGFNSGVRRAKGEVLVFSHDDVEHLAPALGPVLDRHLRRADVVGVAGTTRLVGMNWASSGIRHAHGIVTHPAGAQFEVSLYGVTAPLMQGTQDPRRRVLRHASGSRRNHPFRRGHFRWMARLRHRLHLSLSRGGFAGCRCFRHPARALLVGRRRRGLAQVRRALSCQARIAVVGPYGRWLEVKMRVQTIGDVLGASEFQELVESHRNGTRARKILSPRDSRRPMKLASRSAGPIIRGAAAR